MGRRVNTALHEAWRGRIAEQATSGLTVAAYCHQAGFSEHSFYQWRRRLIDSPPQSVPSARPIDKDSRELMPNTGGSPRTLEGSFIHVPLEFESGSSSLEVILADATRLRVPADHLAAWKLTLQAVMNRAGIQEAEVRDA
jgi:transposase-like protein